MTGLRSMRDAFDIVEGVRGELGHSAGTGTGRRGTRRIPGRRLGQHLEAEGAPTGGGDGLLGASVRVDTQDASALDPAPEPTVARMAGCDTGLWRGCTRVITDRLSCVKSGLYPLLQAGQRAVDQAFDDAVAEEAGERQVVMDCQFIGDRRRLR